MEYCTTHSTLNLDDNTAFFTVRDRRDEAKHRFEARTEEYRLGAQQRDARDGDGTDTICVISYEETQQWRGNMCVLPDGPDSLVWQELVNSSGFLRFIEEMDVETIRREVE